MPPQAASSAAAIVDSAWMSIQPLRQFESPAVEIEATEFPEFVVSPLA